MLKRPYYVALGLVLLAVLVLLNLPTRTATQLKLALGSLFLPLFGLVGSSQQLSAHAVQAVVPRRVLAQQLEALQRENQELRVRLLQNDEVLRENARLRQAVGWTPLPGWRLRYGRVIGREPTDWWQRVQIDLGSRDGLRPDLPVLTVEGLVGRIGAVGLSRAEVILVGDPKCRVAVRVESGDHGIVSAGASEVLDHHLVELTHLPRTATLRPGQRVFTSGQGGVFPAGIPVGTVVDSRSVGYGLYTEARVRLATDSARLEEVFVKLP